MLENFQSFISIASFFIIAVASFHIARHFPKIKLPVLTGFLFTGIITGPHALNLITTETMDNLHFLKEMSLAFIAFTAGAELYLKDIQPRIRSIRWNTLGQVVVTFILGTATIYFLSEKIPFIAGMDLWGTLAIAMLAASIFVASSPSAAVAIMKELRAKGPFTQTAIGVIVLKDVLVIILFGICLTIAGSLLKGYLLNLGFIVNLIIEIMLAFGLGFLIGRLLILLFKLNLDLIVFSVLILLIGYGIYLFADIFEEYSGFILPLPLYIEPLLVCITASFVVINYSKARNEFTNILEDTGPFVYVTFFTLTGASLALDVLPDVWPAALLFFGIRLATIVISSITGGILAGEPSTFIRVGWMPYITQAGLSIGLATLVAEQHEIWGPQFATVMISAIVLNEIIGPPLFKWSINYLGEGKPKATPAPFDGKQDTIIFGLENQSIALARQLKEHNWNVIIASRKKERQSEPEDDINIEYIEELNIDALKQLKAEHADSVVTMLSDEENYHICEMIYENYGIQVMIVRLNELDNLEKFRELGALIVEPSTAMVSLLDHFVRSPQTASLLLGLEEGRDTVDLEIQDKSLHGRAIRDLRLPADTIILSIKRKGQTIISHGYTRLRLGDIVTAVGSNESLDLLLTRFSK